MKGSCPSCGFGAGIEGFLADAEWREAVMATAELPSDVGTFAVRYAGMFRPEKRGLTPSKAARVFREINSMVLDGVEFDRQTIKAPSHIWRQGLIEILDAPNVQRPLKNHNYLLRIMQGLLSKNIDAGQASANQSRRAESRVNSAEMKPVAEALDQQFSSSLPDLPAGDRDTWLAKGRQQLEADGMKPPFVNSIPLIEQRARELYAVQTQGGTQ